MGATRTQVNRARVERHHRARLALLREYAKRRGLATLQLSTRWRGVRLGVWAHVRRQDHRRGELLPWLRRELEATPGWAWSLRSNGPRRKLAALRAFIARRGWAGLAPLAGVPAVQDGVDLREWLAICRSAQHGGRLSPWLVAALEAVPGFSWWPRRDRIGRKVGALRKWLSAHPLSTLEPWSGQTPKVDGVDLKAFVSESRASRRRGSLSSELSTELEALPGWRWQSARQPRVAAGTPLQRRRLTLLDAHIREHGWVAFRGGQAGEVVVEGEPLSRWLNDCRRRRREGELSRWLEERLEALPGWSWDDARPAAHGRYLDQLRTLTREFTCKPQGVPSELVSLALFVYGAQRDHAHGRLSAEVIAALEAIPGWKWQR